MDPGVPCNTGHVSDNLVTESSDVAATSLTEFEISGNVVQIEQQKHVTTVLPKFDSPATAKPMLGLEDKHGHSQM